MSADQILEEASTLYGRWNKLEKEVKRRVIESITDNIVVGSDTITVNLKYLPSVEELTKGQRNLIRSLTFLGFKLTASKPMSCDYPKELKTLGDHLRKRRLDLKLLQREVGQRIGVVEASIWNWEDGRVSPEVKHFPAIIAFLGYNPIQKPDTLRAQLVWHRQGKGWTQKVFAKALGIDQSTLAGWERGERKPMGRFYSHVTAILGTGIRSVKVDNVAIIATQPLPSD